MFLCTQCHDSASAYPIDSHGKEGSSMRAMSSSHGRCEICGDVAVCIDCHCPPPPRPTEREQLDKLREEFIKELES